VIKLTYPKHHGSCMHVHRGSRRTHHTYEFTYPIDHEP